MPDVLRFESELLDYLRRNTSVLDTLRETNVLDDDTVAALNESVDEFKKGFTTGEGSPLASVGKESRSRPTEDARSVEQAQITGRTGQAVADGGPGPRLPLQDQERADDEEDHPRDGAHLRLADREGAGERLAASLPYARAVTRAVSAVATYSNVDHILTRESENPKRAAIVVFSSDRGLAGRVQLERAPQERGARRAAPQRGQGGRLLRVGRKAVGYFRFRRREFVRDWVGGTDNPTAETAHEIADAVVEAFVKDTAEGGVDEIHIVYNRFVSVLTQTPEILRLLPLEVVEGVEEPADRLALPLYEFEPDAAEVLDALLPVYIESPDLYNAMLQSAASKHAATPAGDEERERQRHKLIRDLHQAREQRQAAGDHPADLRDRRRRRRALDELATASGT